MAKHAGVDKTVQYDSDAKVLEINETIVGEDLKVTPGTIARTIVFVVAWINQAFAFVGLPTFEFDSEATYMALSLAFTFIASTAGYWKNNSWTLAAKMGDIIKNLVRKAEE